MAGAFGSGKLVAVIFRSNVRELQRGRIPRSVLAIAVEINTIRFKVTSFDNLF